MSDSDPLVSGVRIADEAIYTAEDRYEEPKEAFKILGAMLAEHDLPAAPRILDAGCATGELLYYLRGLFPSAAFSGLDVSGELLEHCAKALPEAQLHRGSIADMQAAPAGAFDAVTMSGVLCCLDDPKPALDAALTWLAAGGVLLVFDAFNAFPVDVVMRYRRADGPEGPDAAPWELGWNVFSQCSIDRHVGGREDVASWDYVPFRLPFALPQSDDPMRTWTIGTEDNPHQLVNGAAQLVDLSVLRVLKKPA